MKNAHTYLGEIVRHLGSHAVLLLDFDGTLAPIVARPDIAHMNAGMRGTLDVCIARFPTAIISGRTLKDIRPRVGLRGLAYAGNHGFELQFERTRIMRAIPAPTRHALLQARSALVRLAAEYAPLRFEDKTYSLALHYRGVRAGDMPAITRTIASIVKNAGGSRVLRIIRGIKVFDIIPAAEADKGTAARTLAHALGGPRAVPLFIGDDDTDEDAFKALPRGVTIRVGKKAHSAARYYLSSQKDVEPFLRALAQEAGKSKL